MEVFMSQVCVQHKCSTGHIHLCMFLCLILSVPFIRFKQTNMGDILKKVVEYITDKITVDWDQFAIKLPLNDDADSLGADIENIRHSLQYTDNKRKCRKVLFQYSDTVGDKQYALDHIVTCLQSMEELEIAEEVRTMIDEHKVSESACASESLEENMVAKMRWKELLEENRINLLNDIDLSSGLYSQMRSLGLITHRQELAFKAVGDDTFLQKEKLLDFLLNIDPRNQVKFYNALKETNQGYIVEQYFNRETSHALEGGMIQRVTDELKQYYKSTSAMNPIPWCEEFSLDMETLFTNLDIIETRNMREGSNMELTEIFTPVSSNNSQQKKQKQLLRVQLQGDPGTGKTTVCRKLAYDWANDKDYLQQFKFLFLLKARHITGDIGTEIFRQLFPNDIPIEKDSFMKYLSKNQSSVLFVIDGLNTKVRSDLEDLLKGQMFRHSTVFVSSRHIGGPNCNFNRYLVNKGFTSENAVNFVKKYFSSNVPEHYKVLIEKITTKNSNLEALSKNPLNVSLICILWEDNQQLPETKSELYSIIVTCVLKRYCKKHRFNFPEHIQTCFMLLCHSAYQLSSSDKVMFDEKDMHSFPNKEQGILKLGFLIQEKSWSRLQSKTFYTFPHKTMLEFLAAIYVVNNITSTNEYPQLNIDHHQVVCEFVVGILDHPDEDLYKIINKTMNPPIECKKNDISCTMLNTIAKQFHGVKINQYSTFYENCLKEVLDDKMSGVIANLYLELFCQWHNIIEHPTKELLKDTGKKEKIQELFFIVATYFRNVFVKTNFRSLYKDINIRIKVWDFTTFLKILHYDEPNDNHTAIRLCEFTITNTANIPTDYSLSLFFRCSFPEFPNSVETLILSGLFDDDLTWLENVSTFKQLKHLHITVRLNQWQTVLSYVTKIQTLKDLRMLFLFERDSCQSFYSQYMFTLIPIVNRFDHLHVEFGHDDDLSTCIINSPSCIFCMSRDLCSTVRSKMKEFHQNIEISTISKNDDLIEHTGLTGDDQKMLENAVKQLQTDDHDWYLYICQPPMWKCFKLSQDK